MIPDGLLPCKGMTFIFARDVQEVIGGDKPLKAAKPGVRLKTMEAAPPPPDVVANVPSSA